MSALALVTAMHQPFWSSTLALVLVAGGCALLIGLTVALILSRESGRGGVRARIGEFTSPTTTSEAINVAVGPVTSRIASHTERSLERQRWWGEFKNKLEIARIKRSAIEIVYLTAAGSLAGAALLFAVTRTPIAVIAVLAVVPLCARAAVKHQLRRQRILFADQLPSHLQEIAAAMRAGHSIVSGIAAMTEGASEPTRGEFQRVIADEQLGMPLQDALRAVTDRMEAQDMEQVALVAELHHRTGGNMAEVLDRVAEAVRERAELNRELRVLTAQARLSRWVVTALPPVLMFAIYLLNPGYIAPLLHTGFGNFLLALAVGMMIAGSAAMARIIRIEA